MPDAKIEKNLTSPVRYSSAADLSSLGRSLFSDETWQLVAESLSLSPRELQIVQGIFDDKKEYAIALELGISRHTVNTYLQRLYRKLAVNGRVQLVLSIVVASLKDS